MLILKRILSKWIDGVIKNIVYSIVLGVIGFAALIFMMVEIYVMSVIMFILLIVAFFVMEVVYEVIIPSKKGATISQELFEIKINSKNITSITAPLIIKYFVGTLLPIVIIVVNFIVTAVSSYNGAEFIFTLNILVFLGLFFFFMVDFIIFLLTEGKQTLVDKMIGISYHFSEENTTHSNIIKEDDAGHSDFIKSE